MASDNRVPRPKGTYEKMVEKLWKNGIKLSPYDKDFDLDSKVEREKFVDYLKDKVISDDAPDGTSLGFFTRIKDEIWDKKHGQKEDLKNHNYCEKKYMDEYINIVSSNQNCGYKSIYDELIKNGYIPKFYSVLIKDCHNDPDKIKAELFGSKIANLLGVPTVYNFGIKDNSPKPKKWTGEIVGDYFAIGSLDFVPYGYKIESFKDLNHGYYKRTYPSLMMWIDFIDTMLNDRFGGHVDEVCRKKVHEDFVCTHLFRNILFPDSDFAVYNSGIMVSDDDRKFELLPNFDMEGLLYDYTYSPLAISIFENKSRKRDIAYAMEHYPKATTKFMENLKTIANNGMLDEVFDSTLSTIETPFLKTNINKLVNNTLDNYEKVHSQKDNMVK